MLQTHSGRIKVDRSSRDADCSVSRMNRLQAGRSIYRPVNPGSVNSKHEDSWCFDSRLVDPGSCDSENGDCTPRVVRWKS